MASKEELKEVRQTKVDAMRAKGINPYPGTTKKTHTLKQVDEQFVSLQNSGDLVTVVGRVMRMRGQGAISFVQLLDGTSGLQAVLKKDEVKEFVSKSFKESVDMADIIEITGTVFTTERGQQSILIQDWAMLTKALLPLPDKFHGIQDGDLRFRKRYLDILTNPELKELLIKKSAFWASMRSFLSKKGFLEVETPTLEVTTGGAEATPFKTHHNDFGIDVYLRISIGELWQKRLMAAGFDKTFEIGRAYRNEGSSPNHLQEFTNMEFYWSYANYKDGMDLVKEMYQTIAQEVFGTTKFNVRGYQFDLNDKWEELDYQTVIKEKTGIDILAASVTDMMQKLDELGVKYDVKKAQQGRLTDSLWKYCRKQIAGPAFLVNIPKLISPLAKEDPNRPGITQRFQPIIAGTEVGNGFSELNDPVDQHNRFEKQAELIKKGDSEAMMPEWEFVEMLEHGMPPTCGFGAGERLFAILANKPIREVVFFPLMKPKSAKPKKAIKKEAVIVLSKAANLEGWQKLNTTAHLSAEFAGRYSKPKSLFVKESVTTADGVDIQLNIRHAIMIREAETNNDLKTLITKAKKIDLSVSEFTREMIETTSDKKVEQITSQKNFEDVEYLGVLIFGSQKDIQELSKGFDLVS